MNDQKDDSEWLQKAPEPLTIEKALTLRIEAYEFEINRLRGALEGMPDSLRKAKCSDIEAALNGMPHKLMQNMH